MANSFSNKLLTAVDEEFLHQAVTSTTRYRTGQLPFNLDFVFYKYSSSNFYTTTLGLLIPSLAAMAKKEH